MVASIDVVIVGAGLSGIYSLYKMREMGLSAIVLEAGSGVGGTWYWNRYPGARVDVESVDYSYSFSDELQHEWKWTEIFAKQSELRSYLEHVVDRFDLRKDIILDAKVVSAIYDNQNANWRVSTADRIFSARYVIMATGLLSKPFRPDIPGIDRFTGQILQTSFWPEPSPDLSGKRVGVLGNGSSGMQVVQALSSQVGALTLFQRTAGYAIPARNRPWEDHEYQQVRDTYKERRDATRASVVGTYFSAYETNPQSLFDVSEEERNRIFEEYWERGGAGFLGAFSDLITDMKANKIASDWVREKIRSTVKDPVKAAKLLPPDDLPIGCKRICVELGYFDAFNRPNVDIVNLQDDPIVDFEDDKVVTRQGAYPLDLLVIATGFNAFTGSMSEIDIRGRDGFALNEKWQERPVNYLGMVMAGFPNMFTINGPCTVAANFFLASEVQVEWIARLIAYADKNGIAAVETTEQAEKEWLDHIGEVAETVTASNYCQTWFRGTNVPGNPPVVMNYLGGLGGYSDLIRAAEQDYAALTFRS